MQVSWKCLPAVILRSMSFLWLNREDVEALLPMDECIEVVAAALRSLAAGMALQPLRSAVWMPDHHGLLAVMPAMLAGLPADAGSKGAIAGIKVITVVPENHLQGEDSHQGMVMLFEYERGRPVALLDA